MFGSFRGVKVRSCISIPKFFYANQPPMECLLVSNSDHYISFDVSDFSYQRGDKSRLAASAASKPNLLVSSTANQKSK
jgi:hypothetical protein